MAFTIAIINHSITVDGHTSHGIESLKEMAISLGFSIETDKAEIRIVEAIYKGESIDLAMSDIVSCPHIKSGSEAKPEHMNSEELSAEAMSEAHKTVISFALASPTNVFWNPDFLASAHLSSK